MSTKTVNQLDDKKGKPLLEGCLRKLKTMKKKYFVVRGECGERSAGSLEYHDSEKKYRAGHAPKRSIELKTCFNINRHRDAKQKHVIALYNMNDVLCVLFDTDQELDEWLQLLLRLQNGGEDVVDGDAPRPTFDHTWKVRVQDKGLGASQNMSGCHYLCLSKERLCLIDVSNTLNRKEFPLTQIRSFVAIDAIFFMEVGRFSCTGAGEIWTTTDDANIAKNMSEVMRAYTGLKEPDRPRDRSNSANEMSRPSISRRNKPLPPHSGWSAPPCPCPCLPATPTFSVSPPIDVHYHNVGPNANVGYAGRSSVLSAYVTTRAPSLRRHSVSAVSSSTGVHGAAPADVPDGAGPGPGLVISHQRTKSCPVSDSSLPIIVEPYRVLSQSHVSHAGGHRRPTSAKCTTGGRDRCDSLPSRNRTSSEGAGKGSLTRPSSMRVTNSPMDSMDSVASSPSVDETDRAHTPDGNTIPEENTDDTLQWPADPELEAEMLDKMSLGYERPPATLSLPIGGGRGRKTSTSSLPHGSPAHVGDYVVMSPGASDPSRRPRPGSSSSAKSDYMPMSPGDGSRSHPDYLQFSPADSHRAGTLTSSPNQSDYIAMSPGAAASLDYLAMSPPDMVAAQQAARRDTHPDDDYVPMAPAHSDDGYVDMDPLPINHRLMIEDQSDASLESGSVTSGTPSDHYVMDKVCAADFTQSEEEEIGRPARTYSFGSQLPPRVETLVVAAESARVRAFSMGTQQRPTAHKMFMRPTNAKFSSVPHLSTSWSSSSRIQNCDLSSDHMEMDFSKNLRAKYRNLPVVESLINHSADSGYIDMSKSPAGLSPPRHSSSKHLFSPPDGKSTLGRKPPHVIASTTLKTIGEKPDIKPQKFPNTTTVPDSPYVDMKPRTISGSSMDGYMDMTPNAYKMARKNSSDYLPMQPGRKTSEGNNDYMHMSGSKRSSQPIAIVAPSSPTVRDSSNPPQPPNYLPLHPSASSSSGDFSLRRRRKNRKRNERRDSKENIAAQAGIFPLSLNSPQSPKKSQCSDVSANPLDAAPVAEQESLTASLSRVLRISENASGALDDGEYALIRPGAQQWTPQQRLSRGSVGDARARNSISSDNPCESCRLKNLTGASSSDSHSGVSRQVSTSSSSSTEVMSVKEGVCGGSASADITYVTLDLPAEGEEPRSPRPSPAPSPALVGESFSYAEIDFQKSESLRAPPHSYRKIRH